MTNLNLALAVQLVAVALIGGCAADPAAGGSSEALVAASECLADTTWVGDWNAEGATLGYGSRDREAALSTIPRAVLWEDPSPPPTANPAPSGCPDGVHDHCIWLCTGGDPLDGFGDNCSGSWCCPGCPGGDSSTECP